MIQKSLWNIIKSQQNREMLLRCTSLDICFILEMEQILIKRRGFIGWIVQPRKTMYMLNIFWAIFTAMGLMKTMLLQKQFICMRKQLIRGMKWRCLSRGRYISMVFAGRKKSVRENNYQSYPLRRLKSVWSERRKESRKMHIWSIIQESFSHQRIPVNFIAWKKQ